jgi:hypothetical protein
MSFESRPCELEMDFKTYMKFLVGHQDDLGLPYGFAVKLSFLSAPLIYGRSMLIFQDEPYRVVGAAGFVYGTGPNDYEDRHICQVEVVYIEPEFRSTTLFARLLRDLAKLMKDGNPDVSTVQFWTSAEDRRLEGILSKLHALPGSGCTVVDRLALHTVSYHELAAYSNRFEFQPG